MTFKPTALLITCYDPYTLNPVQEFIDKVIAALATSNITVDVEVNPSQLRPLGNAKVVIVFITADYLKNSWAEFLMHFAIFSGKKIIPVIFDEDCQGDYLEEKGYGQIAPVSFVGIPFKEGMKKLTAPFVGQ